jgi:hypothetical protein
MDGERDINEARQKRDRQYRQNKMGSKGQTGKQKDRVKEVDKGRTR